MTVKEAVHQILQESPDLSNIEIAEKVRTKLSSNTTAKDISWYKWDLSRKKTFKPSEVDIDTNTYDPELSTEEGLKNWEKAENFVINQEIQSGAKNVSKVSSNNDLCGFDILSEYPNGEIRHIEVKSQANGKKTWLNFTPNETKVLLKDSNYWLYVVEGNFEVDESINLVKISSADLLKSLIMKSHARVSNLLSYPRNSIKIKNKKL